MPDGAINALRDRLTRLLSVAPAKAPPELLVAIFAGTIQAGLTVEQALRVVHAAADAFDPEMRIISAQAIANIEASVDRPKTYARLSEASAPAAWRRLMAMLSSATASGEDLADRSQAIFDELVADHEIKVMRRAETYPIAMIILMVLFFMPAVLLLLVGPSYILLLRVLRGE